MGTTGARTANKPASASYGAAWFRARLDIRRRWPATVVLVLLVGIVGGGVLAAVAGALRASTAYDRFQTHSLAADLDVTPSSTDGSAQAMLESLPQIEVAVPVAFPFITPQGSGLYPYLDFLAIVGKDTRFGTEVDRVRLLDGRLPAADNAAEVLATTRFAAEMHLEVGDTLTFESYAPNQAEALFSTGDAGPPRGPVVATTVVGIGFHPDEVSESLGTFAPRVVLSPAFYREFVDEVGVYEGGFRLRTNDTDVDRVEQAVRGLFADDGELEVQFVSEITERVEESIDVVVIGLLIGAAGAAFAGIALLAQAITRHLSQAADDQRSLDALGMTKRERTAALVLLAAPAIVLGPLVASVVAVAASPLMPVGAARRAEPDRGLDVDGLVLAVGSLVLVLVLGAIALAVAWRSSRRIDDHHRQRPNALLSLFTNAGFRPSAAIGMRLALDPGRGRAAVPVRSTLAGCAVGVLGLVGVVVFASSLESLVSTPGRYGFPWDATVSGFQDEGIVETNRDDLTADPTVAALGTVATSLAQLQGAGDVNLYAFETLKGRAGPTLLAGRLPAADDEVVLGSESLHDVSAGIGDRVTLNGPGGDVELRVVGRAALPILDDRSGLGRGAVVTQALLERVTDPSTINRDLLVRWASGVAVAEANAALEERTGGQVFAPRLPAEVKNLEDVSALPWAVAGFFAVVAVVALVNALLTTTRRRRHDLAVLRTLGFTPGEASASVAWQATTFGLAGLLIGMPLGVAAGRVAWQVVASGIGVVERPVTPALGLLIIVVAALVAANLVAALPARAVRRTSAASVLRAP